VFESLNLIEGLTLSSAVCFLNKYFGLPESTAKHILRKFRNSGIISAGSQAHQNIPIKYLNGKREVRI
jgi:hypothetical protein